MSTPKLEPVTSSQIAAIGYDPTSQTLTVKFVHGGGTYQYGNFTPDDYKAFRAATSLGSYFLKTIKPNTKRWPYKKLEAQKPS